MEYRIGDWILEIRTKLIFEIVDTNFMYIPPPIHDEHSYICSDYAIQCISNPNHPKEPVGVNQEELEEASILIKNKELALVLYGRG